MTETELNITGVELEDTNPSLRAKDAEGKVSPGDCVTHDAEEASKAPGSAVDALHRWNSPPINKYRVLATFWSFLVLGMNDGSYGVSRNLYHCFQLARHED